MIKVKIKKLVPWAVLPAYAKPGDAGMDLTATSVNRDDYGNLVYGTGLAFEIPEGYFMMLLPRSSNAKTDLMLTNHCGIVDSGYRGEVMFKYKPVVPDRDFDNDYKVGDRIGQAIILPYPTVELELAEQLSETERGAGGYGSTGA